MAERFFLGVEGSKVVFEGGASIVPVDHVLGVVDGVDIAEAA
jgi:hypothetical protein